MASSVHTKSSFKSYEPIQITEDFSALIEDDSKKENKEKRIVEGTVVSIDIKPVLQF